MTYYVVIEIISSNFIVVRTKSSSGEFDHLISQSLASLDKGSEEEGIGLGLSSEGITRKKDGQQGKAATRPRGCSFEQLKALFARMSKVRLFVQSRTDLRSDAVTRVFCLIILVFETCVGRVQESKKSC